METKEPKKYTAKQRFLAILAGTAIMIFIAVLNKSGGNNSEDKGNCNCEYKDELGNRKRTHAIDKQSCESYPGKWLGYDASCNVTKYNAPW
jgi:hypothetical protein